MSLEEKTRLAFDRARTSLRGRMAEMRVSQKDLAEMMGRSAGGISYLIHRDDAESFQEIAASYHPAHKITAQLFRDLAEAHQEAFDIMEQQNMDDLKDATDEIEKLLEDDEDPENDTPRGDK